jgi:hypothetical protein
MAEDLVLASSERNLLTDIPVSGWWVTGLADGEGSFVATMTYRTRIGSRGQSIHSVDISHRFSLALRADDNPTIVKLAQFFGCGHVGDKKAPKSKPDANPQRIFRVDAKDQLLKIIVPHFERFPLHSKKARDFEIWKEIVRFVDVELSGTKGWVRKFPEKLERLQEMCDALVATRQFRAATDGMKN